MIVIALVTDVKELDAIQNQLCVIGVTESIMEMPITAIPKGPMALPWAKRLVDQLNPTVQPYLMQSTSFVRMYEVKSKTSPNG